MKGARSSQRTLRGGFLGKACSGSFMAAVGGRATSAMAVSVVVVVVEDGEWVVGDGQGKGRIQRIMTERAKD